MPRREPVGLATVGKGRIERHSRTRKAELARGEFDNRPALLDRFRRVELVFLMLECNLPAQLSAESAFQKHAAATPNST
jgi:hypothetical protein